METVSHVIGTYHEVALKGGNRPFFERTLARNVRTALAGLPVDEITVPSRVVIRFARPIPWDSVKQRLESVFGLNALIPVARAGTTYEQLEGWMEANLSALHGETFGVRCKRGDKRFPLNSQQVAARLGRLIGERTGMRVDLERPEVWVQVLIQTDGIYVYRQRYPGPGGLPVGTSGRVLVLLSGGIDSPVAAYLAMKRGTKAHFVHFHSGPYTPEASVRKAEEIVRILNRHQGPSRLVVAPFGELQQEIVATCPEKLRVVLYRRMMLRVAERVARRMRCQALVTGESLNQVASQTLENLAAIDRVAHLPVLRPLVSLDKQEIIALAERAGTYELSIMPQQDCCSFLQPLHPATRTTHMACAAAEGALDVEGWARRVQEGAEIRPVDPTPWPAPPAAAVPEDEACPVR
ncbi:MAG: tRNA uracil 4-sulfurtransferase ThiI [Acidobacteriota bacterium]